MSKENTLPSEECRSLASSLAAGLNSLVEGNPGPLEQFGFNQALELSVKLSSSVLSPVAEFGVELGEAVKQAQDLASSVNGVCGQ